MRRLDDLARRYMERHPHDCSNVLMRWWQALWYAAIFTGLVFWTIYRWDVALCFVNFFFSFWYISIILFRGYIVTRTILHPCQIVIPPEELWEQKDEDLPVYTIMVPLYREANIAARIIPRLVALDYPRHKLDIKLLLEEDDTATIQAIRAINLLEYFEVIIVPDSHPKTKPKACNHGLERARGELCVIFDAEDRPEPDQLKKVAAAFRRVPDDVVCIQAKLNYYNTWQNLLTRFFTVEYITTFDVVLPGLQHANIPMPLGGTSNHFRTRALRELDGWDPFNVTEDCDLGMRIYRAGYKTRVIDSTTWEEACSDVPGWLRQRSRWVKGFFQTHLTHTRNPFHTLRELGLRGFFGFVLTVGGSSIMMVLNILYWLAGGAYLLLLAGAMSRGHGLWEVLKGPREAFGDSAAWPMIFYGPKEDPLWSTLSVVFFVITVTLFFANFLFVAIHALACVHKRTYRLLPYALLMPFYWVLISLGAWKGLIQLFTNPFKWEKTMHGLTRHGVDTHKPPGGAE